MNDSTLLTIALISSCVGLLGLFIILQTTHLEETPINNLTVSDNVVKVKGIIVKSRTSDSTTFFTLSQTCTVNAVLFDIVDLQPGAIVEVTGKVEEYKGQKELLVENIHTTP